jgi:cysteine synthase A
VLTRAAARRRRRAACVRAGAAQCVAGSHCHCTGPRTHLPAHTSIMAELISRNPLAACKHASILTTVGKTPLIKLNRMSPKAGVSIYVKVEAFNPMGSVKDRLALGVIEWAEAHGHLQPGQTVVEASSGNTGIGLAMVCAAKGYPYVCVMAESFSIERRKLMRFLGAKVILTNPAHKGSGMVIKCAELAEKHGWFNTDQFSNEANAWVHTQTTGPEILEAMGETKLTDFFCAWGTGGTLKGTASHLREASPETKVHCCEPDNAPLLYSGTKTEYEADGRFTEPHPVWRPHLLQGWAPDFIPKLLAEAIDAGFIDSVHHVGGDAAQETARALAQKEVIFSGIISSL